MARLDHEPQAVWSFPAQLAGEESGTSQSQVDDGDHHGHKPDHIVDDHRQLLVGCGHGVDHASGCNLGLEVSPHT